MGISISRAAGKRRRLPLNPPFSSEQENIPALDRCQETELK
jgi:hypothetical protein